MAWEEDERVGEDLSAREKKKRGRRMRRVMGMGGKKEREEDEGVREEYLLVREEKRKGRRLRGLEKIFISKGGKDEK